MSEKITAMIEEIKGLTVLELSELVHALEEEFGVSAAAMAAPAAGAAAPAAEEKTEFDVVLAGFDAAQKIKVIKEIDPNIMVEQAAGITCGQEVYDFIMAGSEAAGAASGIMNAADPIAMIDEMIAATRRAADDLKKQEG